MCVYWSNMEVLSVVDRLHFSQEFLHHNIAKRKLHTHRNRNSNHIHHNASLEHLVELSSTTPTLNQLTNNNNNNLLTHYSTMRWIYSIKDLIKSKNV
jgi:hypothetical protein